MLCLSAASTPELRASGLDLNFEGVGDGTLGTASILSLFDSWRGGDEVGWRWFDDAVERTEIAGDGIRAGSRSEEGITDFGIEGIGGGSMQVWSSSWSRGTGCRHVEHFIVGKS